MMDIKLYLQCCIEYMQNMPGGSVDLIVADPPYGMNYKSNWPSKDKQKKKIANDKRPYVEWIPHCLRVVKDGGAVISFCRWDSWSDFAEAFENAGFTVKSQIVWDKKNHGTGDLMGAPGNRHELAVFATKGRFIFPGKRPQSVFSVSRVNTSMYAHPTEKPVELMRKIVEHFSPAGGTVFDPFAGVSPVGVACIKEGRSYVGTEIDPEYFNIAVSRTGSA